MLKVGVHDDHRLAVRRLQSGAQGMLLAEIPAEPDGRHVAAKLPIRFDGLPRPVRGTVIDQKDRKRRRAGSRVRPDRVEGSDQ